MHFVHCDNFNITSEAIMGPKKVDIDRDVVC